MTFTERLEDLRGDLSARAFALQCRIGDGTMRALLNGAAKPTLDTLVAIHRGTGVALDWLAMGVGPKYLGGDAASPPEAAKGDRSNVDIALLAVVIRQLEAFLEASGKVVDPDAKATFIAGAYSYFEEERSSAKTHGRKHSAEDTETARLFRLFASFLDKSKR